MDVLPDFLSLFLRWLHVIAGVAWIGSSFYFIHLDLGLRPASDLPTGTHGEAWQVHGGGFYHLVKYLVAPTRMPDHLTWFKWEAYTTWLSGFGLLVVTYYSAAGLFLVDQSVVDMSAGSAVGLSVGVLIACWIAYEGLCRSVLARSENLLALTGFAFLVAVCFALTFAFSGRGVFIQMGAVIGTMMVANVFVVIIPNQKKVVADLVAGRTPDPRLGAQAKQRSVHNNYLTLPVIFVMISNHYPLVYATRYNWLIFAIVLLIGAVIRHFYNRRHAGKGNPWWAWAVAVMGAVAIIWLAEAGTVVAADEHSDAAPTAPFSKAAEVIATRCVMCHTATPAWDGILHAPRNVMFDTPREIKIHARQIEAYAVLSRAMPPGNVTEMTDQERALVGAGLKAVLHD